MEASRRPTRGPMHRPAGRRARASGSPGGGLSRQPRRRVRERAAPGPAPRCSTPGSPRASSFPGGLAAQESLPPTAPRPARRQGQRERGWPTAVRPKEGRSPRRAPGRRQRAKVLGDGGEERAAARLLRAAARLFPQGLAVRARAEDTAGPRCREQRGRLQARRAVASVSQREAPSSSGGAAVRGCVASRSAPAPPAEWPGLRGRWLAPRSGARTGNTCRT